MKKNVKNISLIGLAVGLVATPLVIWAVRRMRNRLQEENEGQDEHKHLFTHYKGKRHHRQAAANGHHKA